MSRLRAGVLGIGQMGHRHARVLSRLEGVELIGVADPQGDRFGCARGARVVRTLDALLGLGLDLCVVAVPTADHEEAGIRLAGMGVHTLIEKPLAQDVAAAGRLVRAFERTGLVGCVGHIERCNPALVSLRSRLEAGELGTIFQIATRRQSPFPERIRDVGVVNDLATHDIDLTAWVAGSPFSSISARTAHTSGREHEDLVAATGLLADGTITNHLVNWLTPMKERITVITGERGCFVANTLTADLIFYANGRVLTDWEAISQFRGVSEGDMIRYAIPRPEPLYVQLAAFRDAVLGRPGGVVVPLRDGLAAVRIAQACLSSARRGVTIDLEPLAAGRAPARTRAWSNESRRPEDAEAAAPASSAIAVRKREGSAAPAS
jgi:predicted dehydrogenase